MRRDRRDKISNSPSFSSMFTRSLSFRDLNVLQFAEFLETTIVPSFIRNNDSARVCLGVSVFFIWIQVGYT